MWYTNRLIFTWPNTPKRKIPKVKRFETEEEHRRTRWVLNQRSKTVLSGGGGRTAVVTPVRVRMGGRARHAPPPAYRPPRRRRRRGGKKLSRRRCWRRRRHRTKLYFTHDGGGGDDDDVDPLSISFSLFRISALGACYIHVIISATRKILVPHSLHVT